jgi:hypothetical protein
MCRLKRLRIGFVNDADFKEKVRGPEPALWESDECGLTLIISGAAFICGRLFEQPHDVGEIVGPAIAGVAFFPHPPPVRFHGGDAFPRRG